MTYVLYPDSSQSLGQTQAGIKNNFSLIKTTIDQNHVDLDLAGKGKHTVIQIPVLGAIPANPIPPGGLSAGDATIYSKTAGAESQLFFTPDASGNEYQLTNAITAKFTTFSTLTEAVAGNKHFRGWTFLPGGLLLQYGRVDTPSSSGNAVFPVAFSTTPFSVQLTLRDSTASNAQCCIDTVNSTSFTYLVGTSGGDNLHWMAIGPA